MGRDISLFNDYHTKENILSNHCGLILKLLYEENPKSFEEVISVLTNQDFQITPSFSQQIKKDNSIPDILIEQQSFSIFFETKIGDWFGKPQIKSHLNGFTKEIKYKILFLLSNFEEDYPDKKFDDLIKKAKDVDIILSPISFEKLIGTLEIVETTDHYKRYLIEFREFLERNDYLPTWNYMLDVVNSSNKIDEIHNHDVYMCPNTGGTYKHRRCKFLGGYSSKNVKYIHEIKALVVIEKGGEDGSVIWKNFTNNEDDALIKEAIKKIELCEGRKNDINQHSLKVFLLQNPIEANFKKSSSGGLYSTKRYFDFKKYKPKNSNELAEIVKNGSWETYITP